MLSTNVIFKLAFLLIAFLSSLCLVKKIRFILQMSVLFKTSQLEGGNMFWFLLQGLFLSFMKNTFCMIFRNSPKQCVRTDFYTLSVAPEILSSFLGNGNISGEVMEDIPTKRISQQHAYVMCLGNGRCSWRFIWSRVKCNPSALCSEEVLSMQKRAAPLLLATSPNERATSPFYLQ